MVKGNETDLEPLLKLARNTRLQTGSQKQLLEEFLKSGLKYKKLDTVFTNGQISGFNNRYSQKAVVKNFKDENGKTVTYIMTVEVYKEIIKRLKEQ